MIQRCARRGTGAGNTGCGTVCVAAANSLVYNYREKAVGACDRM
jgi:hypothetical protein